jgi:ankyrin repeat protein
MSSANEKLVAAAKCGNVPEIAAALLAGADPNAFRGAIPMTPLQRAADSGHVAAITTLVAAGARVDCTNSGAWTPLMIAALNGHTAAVDALLTAGADVHRVDTLGHTPLHSTSMRGLPDPAQLLLEAGARTDVRNKWGKRPIDVVRALLARSLRLCLAVAPL